MVRFFELRGTGKTMRLMQMASAQNGIFVSANPKFAKKMAKDKGFDPEKIIFMGFSEFINGECEHYNKPVFIDEAENMLQYIAHWHLKGYSIGIEDNEQYWPYLYSKPKKHVKCRRVKYED